MTKTEYTGEQGEMLTTLPDFAGRDYDMVIDFLAVVESSLFQGSRGISWSDLR